MKRTVQRLCFPTWQKYGSFLANAYTALPQPGDSIRVDGVWLVVDEDGYVRLASRELASRLEQGFRNES